MKGLKQALQFGGILTKQDIEKILPHYQIRVLAPQEDWISYRQIAREIAYVQSGIMRVYAIGPQGEEVTKYFFRPNQFAVSLESYYNSTSIEEVFQAVIASELQTISRSSWETLSEEIPNLYIFMKSLTEATLLNKLKDNDFLNFGTARDKYYAFVKRYPDLVLQTL